MMDAIVFVIAAIVCLTGAVGVIVAKNPVHSALMLVMTLFGIAVQFVAQEAHFLAAVQVIVYAGAIVVLFLFVIMLLGVDTAADIEFGSLRFQKQAAAGFGVIGLAVLGWLLTKVDTVGAERPAVTAIDDNVANIDQLAGSLFEQYVYAFELTSVLLVVAVIGAVVLSRRPRPDLEQAPAEPGGES